MRPNSFSDRDDPPTAIFSSNDDMAAATVAVAHKRGLDVPGDLTVCGFDDTTLATTIWPELTTIHQPIADMSRAAIDVLASRCADARDRPGTAPTARLYAGAPPFGCGSAQAAGPLASLDSAPDR